MNLQKLKEEAKSFTISVVSFLMLDGLLNMSLFAGDFSSEAIKAFLFAVLRAILKAMINQSLPQTNASLNESGEGVISEETKL